MANLLQETGAWPTNRRPNYSGKRGRGIHRRVLALLERLRAWPAISGAKPLRGDLAGWYRLRTGDYRLRFRCQGEEIIVEQIGRSMSASAARKKPGPEYRVRGGRRVVVLDEAEHDRLRARADEWEPLLPEPDANGNYPAVEYARASLVRKIIRHRRRLGLTQVELARRAGIRPETLNRVEQGKTTPSLKTVGKIDRALRMAEEKGQRRT